MASRSMSIYEPQLMVPRAVMPELTGGSVAGEAAAQAGRVLGVLDQKMRADAHDWVTSNVADLRNDLTKRKKEAEANGQGEAFALTFEDDLAERAKALEKDMPPYARRAFEAGVENVRVDFLRPYSAVPDEQQAAAAEPTRAGAAETFAKHQETVSVDPDQLAHVHLEAAHYLGALPPAQRAELAPMVDDIPRHALNGLIKTDPRRVREMFGKGEVKNYIPDPRLRSLYHGAFDAEQRLSESRKVAVEGAASLGTAFDLSAKVKAAAQGKGSFIDALDPAALKAIGPEHARAFRKYLGNAQAEAKQRADERDAVVKAMTSGKALDANDPAQQRGLDDLYENHFAPDLEGRTPEEQRQRKLDFIGAAGVVPEQVRREINADLRSGDPRRMADAAQFIDELERKDPAFGKAFDSGDRRTARAIASMTASGIDGIAAAKNFLEAGDLAPEKRAQREQELQRLLAAASDVSGEVERGIREALGIPAETKVERDDSEDVGARMHTLERRQSNRVLRDGGTYNSAENPARVVQLDYSDPYGGSAGGMMYGGSGPPPSELTDPLQYDPDDLKKVGDYREPILRVAKELGVSEEAIAGGIAEELDDARRRGDKEHALWLTKWAYLGARSHRDIEEQYDQFEADLAKDPRLGYEVPKGFDLAYQKWKYPTMLDIGMGKIRLHTAIRMLRDYNARYPDTDPLDIKKYNGAYDQLARDLESAEAATTAAFAGLVVAEATRWFETKAPDTWSKLNSSDRAALIVDYYNLGRETIVHRYQQDMERDGRYSPGFGDSGDSHRANAQRVWRALYPL